MKFRKKPIMIEAIQYTGDNCHEILVFMGNLSCVGNCDVHDTDRPAIYTLEGMMIASPGDWIIEDAKGDFHLCKANIFAATYEEVKP